MYISYGYCENCGPGKKFVNNQCCQCGYRPLIFQENDLDKNLVDMDRSSKIEYLKKHMEIIKEKMEDVSMEE